jgi:RimJ/RimL family protein N-acetyltransferase
MVISAISWIMKGLLMSNPGIVPHPAQECRQVLATDRLLLRLWRDEDVAPFVALNADPAVTEFLPGPVTPGQAAQFFAAQNALHARHGCCYFAAELKSTGKLAGLVGLKYQDFDTPFAPCHEVGWRLASRYWGQGLASEGARAALRFGFERLGLDEIVSFTVARNLRSRRVLERLGMVRDPGGVFAHPALPTEHPLSRHVLYRLPKAAFGAA